MNRQKSLANLRSAKSFLVEWKSSIQGFAMGLPVDPKRIPLNLTDSVYSKWFFIEGQAYKNLPSFQNMGPLLEETFSNFQVLYNFLQKPIPKAGLFGSQKKIDEEHKKKVEELLSNTLFKLQDLIDHTRNLEKEAMQLTDEEFDEMI